MYNVMIHAHTLMIALRSALLLAFGSLLFLSSMGEAHAEMYAYLDPCQALGVACPGGGAVIPPEVVPSPPPPTVIPTPEMPAEVPVPLLEIPQYVPPQPVQTYDSDEPMHSAAPLPRTGMGGVFALLLLSLSGTVCWTQSFRPL